MDPCGVGSGSPVDSDGYYDTEHDKVDFLCFGLVCGFADEVGYVSLAELLSVAGQGEQETTVRWEGKSNHLEPLP